VSKPFKVAYMMSRFPKITETFVLYEMLAVMEQGVKVEIYPLMREHTTVMHPEAVPLVEEAHFTPHISLAILASNIKTFFRQPRTYIRTLATTLRATWGSKRFFGGILAFFPKSVYLAQEMQAAGIEHLHAHFASFPAASAYIIHQFTGIPYSFTAHGSDLHRDKKMLREKVADAKFVVAISKDNQRIITEHCHLTDAAKVPIVHCGVDTEAFKPVSQHNPSSALNIVCTGTLHEVKGQTYLVKACAELKKRKIPFQCHFVGDGPDEAALKEQAAQAGLSGDIVFHGRVPRLTVIEIMKNADIFALPSVPTQDGRREGIPVALMEAMAFAVPVVSSELSGIPELVENGVSGLLVPPRDVKGLADSLARLATDHDLRRCFGEAGRQKVLKDFDLSQNASLLITLFQE
jgi:colanic acid/amylovoran biosynthesis glycosyltransferase